MEQVEIFPQALPGGLVYREDFISADEEQRLLAEIQRPPLSEAKYQQHHVPPTKALRYSITFRTSR